MHQGTYVSDKVEKTEFDPQKLIANVHNEEFSLKQQRKELDLLEQLDQLNMKAAPGATHDAQLEATIGAMETAYRMQTEAPDVFDVRKESEATIKMYGEGSTARGCMMAARLIERGVRVVQVWAGGWDHHQNLEEQLPQRAKDIDQPLAAFITDLKQRNLFDGDGGSHADRGARGL